MASKIHTDNPKHHAYVVVNKRERKKARRKPLNQILLSLAKEAYYLFQKISCGYGSCAYSYTQKNTRIIWLDCNHTRYVKIYKVQGHWNFWSKGVPKEHKRPYNAIY